MGRPDPVARRRVRFVMPDKPGVCWRPTPKALDKGKAFLVTLQPSKDGNDPGAARPKRGSRPPYHTGHGRSR